MNTIERRAREALLSDMSTIGDHPPIGAGDETETMSDLPRIEPDDSFLCGAVTRIIGTTTVGGGR